MNDDYIPSDQDLESGIIYSKKKTLLKDLKRLEDDLPPVDLTKPWYRQKWWLRLWLIVLLLGMIITVILLKWSGSSSPRVNPTIAAYFRPNPSLSATLRSSEITQSLEGRAFAAYNAENYADALPLLEELFSTEKDTTALFWLGIAQLGSGNAVAAAQNLERFRKLQPGNQKEKVHFYLMLAYLQSGQPDQVRQEAAQLQTNEFRMIAEEVLQTLPTPK